MPNVPVPRTWVDDQDYLSSSVMNTEFRDTFNFLLAPPKAVLRRVAAQSVPTGTAVTTPAQWDTEDLDTAGGFTVASNTRYTAQYPGYYKISVIIGWTAHATGIRVICVNVNGGANIYLSIVNTVGAGANTVQNGVITIPYRFSVGDYFQIQLAQSSGVSLAHAGGTDSYCTIEWVGA